MVYGDLLMPIPISICNGCPVARAELDELIEWFSDKKIASGPIARLPEGGRFDESILAIQGTSTEWSHTAFARTGRDYVHVYTSDEYGILLRTQAASGTIQVVTAIYNMIAVNELPESFTNGSQWIN